MTAAEFHRIRRKDLRAVLVAYLILLLAFVAALEYGTPGSARKICRESKENRTALRAIIMRGRDVGKPGSPGYAYYKAHPGEARKARARVDQALKDLPPIKCDGGVL